MAFTSGNFILGIVIQNFTNTLLFSHRLVVALDADEGIEAWHVYMENCLVMLWLYYLAI